MHRKQVQRNQYSPEDQTESPSRKVVGPVLEHQLQSNQICRGGNSIIEPVVPGQSKPKCVVDEPPT